MLHAGGKLLNKSCVQSNALPCLSARHRRAVRAKASSDAGTGIKGPAPLPDPVLGDMRIILVSPKTPGNIGSVCRVAACFEAPQVYVVAPRCDPFSEEAKMMASSCPQLLQGITVVPSLEVALADTQGSIGFTRRAGATRVTHKSLLDLLRTDPQAIPCMVLPKQSDQAAGFPLPQPPLGVTGLVFGREESGLSEAEMHLCTHACAIPTGRLQGSMNLSHAVAVVQAELFQRRLLFLEQAGAPGGQQGVAGQTMSPGGQDPLLMGTSVSGPADVTSASPQQPWPMEQQGHEAGPPQVCSRGRGPM
ncbi:SpoU rRNA methylase family-domain-containing protein [Dunaliella salina]|uniref:SpoU rRNA methylase family-domain-containing protein n=1 Tax=Dunaliella salina TaxID=3046 RepID=A0ABQ7GIC5_DUNSA|nr:SpoU rRNA methylase family-domain-containing protein [Dunaliella salina]|eukprot:KAF5834308.1 SpoU rRNA methylase family-domain-containing protein [Dunaliella salina]